MAKVELMNPKLYQKLHKATEALDIASLKLNEELYEQQPLKYLLKNVEGVAKALAKVEALLS